MIKDLLCCTNPNGACQFDVSVVEGSLYVMHAFTHTHTGEHGRGI